MRLILTLSILFLFTYLSNAQYFRLGSNDKYIPKTVILKVKPEYRDNCSANNINFERLNNYFSELGTVKLGKIFPNKDINKEYDLFQKSELIGGKFIDLTLIYKIEYTSEKSIEEVINSLYSLKIFEYIEPEYENEPLFIPNDPGAKAANAPNYNYALTLCKVFEGWDISTGDTNVVIGLTDTGSDIDHPDLVNNVKKNYSDPINGVDDDGNGLIDDFTGWDFGNSDNTTQCETNAHGVHTQGLCAATTNNTIGTAGSGYKCKVLPLKIMNTAGSMVNSYTAIVYAADRGCKVINCSWGSTGTPSQYNQDVIYYATLTKDALVVAAAGNNNDDVPFYPASYHYVLSVANTNQSDIKVIPPIGSSYGKYVDVCAPGYDLYTTENGGGYRKAFGTSMSSPFTAGCAAIVRSYYPSFTAVQAGEQLKISADVIDNLPGNAAYKDQLGYGRINLYKALTVSKPSLKIIDYSLTDNHGDVFSLGDTVFLRGEFINFLKPATNMVINITSESPYIQIIDDSTNIGEIGTYQIKDNNNDPFSIKILNTTPELTTIYLKIEYLEGDYRGFEYISFVANKNYIDVDINNISTSVTSKGMIGYNNSANTQGLGLEYNNNNLIFAGSLMVGTSDSKVSDMTYGSSSVNPYDADFNIVKVIKKVNSNKCDYETYGEFNDDNAAANKLNVKVKHKSYFWENDPKKNFYIVEYKIINNGASALNGFSAGLFCDFDIDQYSNNIGNYNSTNKLIYTYPSTQAVFAGVSLLTQQNAKAWINENPGVNGSLNLYDNFSGIEKYNMLSTNKLTADTNDISQSISCEPLNLNAGDSITLAFAIVCGSSLTELKTNTRIANSSYNLKMTFNNVNNKSCSYNCDGSATANVIGGVQPYSYLWSDANAQTTNIATGLCEGLYYLTVTDSLGISIVDSIQITSPDTLNISFLINDIKCLSDTNATIQSIVTGGTSPYNYLWNDSENQTTALATKLFLGEYIVNITDFNNCIVSDTVVLDNSKALRTIFTGDTIIGCTQNCSGTINLQLKGGEKPYSFSWNDASTDSVRENLCEGVYSYTLSDNLGCVFIDTINIIKHDTIIIDFDSVKHISCFGLCDGAVRVKTNGIEPVTYTWNSVGNNTTVISNLCKGEYYLTVFDAKGCLSIDTIEIIEPAKLSLSTSFLAESCCKYCDAKAIVLALGGTQPYNYLWNDNLAQANDTSFGLCIGNYTVTVTDANGCTKNKSVNITSTNCLNVNLTIQDPSCFKYSDGSINVIANNAQQPIQYLWTPLNQNASSINNLSSGIYRLNLIDNKNCVIDTVIVLSQPDSLFSFISLKEDIKCNNECNGKATVIAVGGTMPYSYLWNSSQETSITAYRLCKGSNIVQVTDAKGCITSSDTIINSPDSLYLTLQINDETSHLLCDGNAKVNIFGGTPPYYYLWGTSESTDSIYNLCSGYYSVIVTDSNDCFIDTMAIIGYNNIAEITDFSLFEVYPNPCNSELNLSLNAYDNTSVDIEIINIKGEVFYYKNVLLNKIGINELKINTDNISSGIYFLKINSENNYIVQKIVIKH